MGVAPKNHFKWDHLPHILSFPFPLVGGGLKGRLKLLNVFIIFIRLYLRSFSSGSAVLTYPRFSVLGYLGSGGASCSGYHCVLMLPSSHLRFVVILGLGADFRVYLY